MTIDDKLRNKYVSNLDGQNVENKKIIKLNNNLDLPKKKTKKTYTLVRIEDEITDKFKQFVQDNSLESHGVIINEVLKNFLIDINYLPEKTQG